jgi:hypothetical protein
LYLPAVVDKEFGVGVFVLVGGVGEDVVVQVGGKVGSGRNSDRTLLSS